MIRTTLMAAALVAITATVYLLNGRTIVSGDTLPTRCVPFSLIREGNFDLDEFAFLHDERARACFPTVETVPYYLRKRGEHVYSAYTIGPALLALPVYLVPVLSGIEAGSEEAEALEKYAATGITVLSVLFLFLALAHLISRWWAIVFALVYGLGTSSLSISSQALWQHGPSQMMLSLTLFLLVRAEKIDERHMPFAALALGAAATMRALNLFVALPLGIWLLLRHRRQVLPCLVAFLMPLAPLLVYYLIVFGAPSPTFENIEIDLLSWFKQIPLYEGLFGSLFGLARGLFVYSPVLLFAVGGVVIAARTRDGLAIAVAAGAVLVMLLVGKWFMWWGGHCYGPRLLADIGPLLCFLFYPLANLLSRRKLAAAAFFSVAVVSIGIHLLGAFMYDGRWDVLAETDLDYGGLIDPPAGGPIGFYGGDLLQRLGLTDALSPERRGEGPDDEQPIDTPAPLGRLIEGPIEERPDPLRTELSTDRRTYHDGDTMRLDFSVIDPGRPRAMNIYFIVRPPRGWVAFFDGYRLHRRVHPRDQWPSWVRHSPGCYGFNGSLDVHLEDWPPGDYTWYLLFTDARRLEPLGRASAAITVERGAAP